MERTIRSIAGALAVLLFFVVALVAWWTGCEPATCAYRALTGGIITYCVVSIAGRLIRKIILDEMINSRIRQLTQQGSGQSP